MGRDVFEEEAEQMFPSHVRRRPTFGSMMRRRFQISQVRNVQVSSDRSLAILSADIEVSEPDESHDSQKDTVSSAQ